MKRRSSHAASRPLGVRHLSLLWVFYQNNVQKLKLSDLPSSHPVTIGPDVKDSVTIGTIPFESGVISLQRKESGGQYEVFQEMIVLAQLSRIYHLFSNRISRVFA